MQQKVVPAHLEAGSPARRRQTQLNDHFLARVVVVVARYHHRHSVAQGQAGGPAAGHILGIHHIVGLAAVDGAENFGHLAQFQPHALAQLARQQPQPAAHRTDGAAHPRLQVVLRHYSYAVALGAQQGRQPLVVHPHA